MPGITWTKNLAVFGIRVNALVGLVSANPIDGVGKIGSSIQVWEKSQIVYIHFVGSTETLKATTIRHQYPQHNPRLSMTRPVFGYPLFNRLTCSTPAD